MPIIFKPKRNYNKDSRRKERQAIYQTKEWIELREAKLMQNPLCEICLEQGKITFATDVHHKDSFMNYDGYFRVAKAFAFDNLQSLCRECHNNVHNNIK